MLARCCGLLIRRSWVRAPRGAPAASPGSHDQVGPVHRWPSRRRRRPHRRRARAVGRRCPARTRTGHASRGLPVLEADLENGPLHEAMSDTGGDLGRAAGAVTGRRVESKRTAYLASRWEVDTVSFVAAPTPMTIGEAFLRLIDAGIDRMGIGCRSTPAVLGLAEDPAEASGGQGSRSRHGKRLLIRGRTRHPRRLPVRAPDLPAASSGGRVAGTSCARPHGSGATRRPDPHDNLFTRDKLVWSDAFAPRSLSTAPERARSPRTHVRTAPLLPLSTSSAWLR